MRDFSPATNIVAHLPAETSALRHGIDAAAHQSQMTLASLQKEIAANDPVFAKKVDAIQSRHKQFAFGISTAHSEPVAGSSASPMPEPPLPSRTYGSRATANRFIRLER